MNQEPSILLQQVWDGDGNAAVVLTDYLLENLTPDKWVKITGRPVRKKPSKDEGAPTDTVDLRLGIDTLTGRVVATLTIDLIKQVTVGKPARLTVATDDMAKVFPKWLTAQLSKAREATRPGRRWRKW